MTTESSKSILIIDDEENIRKYLKRSLSKNGFETYTAQYGKEGINLLVQKHIDVILLDLNLPDIDGIEVLKEIKKLDAQSVVIIITAYGDINSAVEAIKLGAFDYLPKPFDFEDIKIVINNAFKVIGLENHIKILERQVDRYQHGELITRSKKMHELLEFVEQVANTSATVMIYGETGTGKELIAALIHRKSQRADKPLVTIDCTSLPETLLESELFGHEKGAFTGAVRLKRGLFEVGTGGSVFLDEIGELPLMLQAKILRVIETNSFRRVGAEKYIKTDVRIIAATNRDLNKMAKEERFRSDLFYRLNVVPIHLPPLRERKGDIFPLVEYFVQIFNKRIGKNITEVSNELVKILIDYDWPGNIRELKNVIEHIVIICKRNVIQADDLPIENISMSKNMRFQPDKILNRASKPNTFPDFQRTKKDLVERFEKEYLKSLLKKNQWNISQSAREIKMQRSSLQRLIRKHGLRE